MSRRLEREILAKLDTYYQIRNDREFKKSVAELHLKELEDAMNPQRVAVREKALEHALAYTSDPSVMTILRNAAKYEAYLLGESNA